jgi:hypothetical protein
VTTGRALIAQISGNGIRQRGKVNITYCDLRNNLPSSTDDHAPLNPGPLSISLPAELMVQLDAMVAERGLPSRSQMIAELIRHELAEHSAARPTRSWPAPSP